MNAILNKNASSIKGCRLYSVLFPCNECAKLIIQAGISHVIYMHDKPNKPEMQASRFMFDKTNVKYTSVSAHSFPLCSLFSFLLSGNFKAQRNESSSTSISSTVESIPKRPRPMEPNETMTSFGRLRFQLAHSIFIPFGVLIFAH